jgi:hypothetical protein
MEDDDSPMNADTKLRKSLGGVYYKILHESIMLPDDFKKNYSQWLEEYFWGYFD